MQRTARNGKVCDDIVGALFRADHGSGQSSGKPLELSLVRGKDRDLYASDPRSKEVAAQLATK